MTAEVVAKPKTTDREDIAKRLLRGSAKASFDPLVEIDWDAPVDPDMWAIRPERISIYGTPLWDSLSEEKRKELSRLEVASVATIGIWFETILMQMLVRHAYRNDPTTLHVQYAYTEIADECRHSIMFARGAKKLGAPAYRPPRAALELGRLFKTVAFGEAAYAAILVAEEVLDVMRTLASEGMTMIVVTHEIGFARDVANDVVFMDEGVIVEEGPVKRVIDSPREERTRQFLGLVLEH